VLVANAVRSLTKVATPSVPVATPSARHREPVLGRRVVMTEPEMLRPVRLAHTIDEAAAVLHMSPTLFRKEVLPYIRVVRRGKRTIVPRSELQRWLNENAEPL
jgi:hypothetical protein